MKINVEIPVEIISLPDFPSGELVKKLVVEIPDGELAKLYQRILELRGDSDETD